MKQIKVTIIEKDKQGKHLNLFNLREEVVNFMYKKTVADSSRISMRFFIVIFFLSLKIKDTSLLMKIFDENIEKLKKLNSEFRKKEKLEKGEYAQLVKQEELDRVFANDIFFILVAGILDSGDVLNQFNRFFLENEDIRQEYILVVNKYKAELDIFDLDFKNNLISDDRLDELGEYRDLSKSVYRTIKMRTSRQIDLSLHRYAELRIIKSESPIDLSIIQHINPQIIFDLWETYKLGDYLKGIWDIANSPIVSGIIGGIVVQKWNDWKSIDGKKDRKKKNKARSEFEIAKNDSVQNERLLTLAEVLAESVMRSNEHLREEVRNLKEQLIEKRSENLKENTKIIEELRLRLLKLENIVVETTEKETPLL